MENEFGDGHLDRKTDSEPEVTFKDVVELLSGEATLETRRRIANAIYDPNHPLSYLARQSTQGEPFVKKWPPDDMPQAIRDLLNEDG